jgi:hypothetical protein
MHSSLPALVSNDLNLVQMADKKDVLSFRLATDMIEQFKQIAHFARRIAAITKKW